MIIKLIPETEQERLRSTEVEIRNINEFFLMGNNVTDEGDINEFHEWTGSYRYLMGTLQYYSEVINDERREAQSRRSMNSPSPVGPQLRVVEAEVDEVDDPEILNFDDNVDDNFDDNEE